MEDHETIVESSGPLYEAGNWVKNSISFKLIIICVLTLLLLIPAMMIRSVISERANLNQETTTEVSSNWAREQVLTGPILNIPVKKSSNGPVEYLHILPNELGINGKAEPHELKRGIYNVVVYEAALTLEGSFTSNLHIDESAYASVEWDKAFLTMGITDMRGIKNQMALKINGVDHAAVPGSGTDDVAQSGVHFDLSGLHEMASQGITFSSSLDLQGSKDLSFIPVGDLTTISLASTWNAPNFNGNFLPDERQVEGNGFTANWKVLQLNRNYPSSWEGTTYQNEMSSSAFGVSLIQPVDDYQKSMRSVKYAILILALTFLMFFLSEILNGRRIHPFQYILVGLALCLFYILLISFTEHLNFNEAYLISASAIVLMISLYSIPLFKSVKLSAVLFILLSVLYSFLFVTLQLADYALLMGSIGLTAILGLTMFFTRKINWYAVRKPEKG